MDEIINCSEEGCPSTFRFPSSLRRHATIVHHRPRNVQCPTCLKCFRDNYNLKVHLKVHMEGGGREHENGILCEDCGKSFTLRAAYSNHIKVHNRRKPEIKMETSEQGELGELGELGDQIEIQREPSPLFESPESSSDSEFKDVERMKCYACLKETDPEGFLSHVQVHVRNMITACSRAVETMQKFEESLTMADKAVNRR